MSSQDATVARYPPPRLTRWQVFWRYGLVVANLVVSAVFLASRGVTAVDPAVASVPLWQGVLDLVLGVLATLVIRFRRRWPLPLLAVVAMMAMASSTAGVVVNWALVSVATRRRWGEIAAAVAIFLASSGMQVAFFGSRTPRLWESVFVVVTIVVFAVALVTMGMFVGARRDLIAALRDRADTAEREQELRVLQGQAAERNRIAREMHDVLAHRMSLVSMHAGILAFRDDLTAEETREIARVIQENSHASLTELRSVLGSLRNEDDAPGELEKPQPERLDVDDLVAEARSGGDRVDYTTTIEHPELLPATTARHGYRIVQEALTNARKHARNCRVCLELSGAPGEGLTIRSRNPMPLLPQTSEVPGSRVGLVGVRERVDVTGGRMAVRQDDGFFELEVWLPW